MACKEKMVAEGFIERDFEVDPTNLDAIGKATTEYYNAKRAWIEKKFGGICEDGCELFIDDAIEPVINLDDTSAITIRYTFTVTCDDPEEEEQGGEGH